MSKEDIFNLFIEMFPVSLHYNDTAFEKVLLLFTFLIPCAENVKIFTILQS